MKKDIIGFEEATAAFIKGLQNQINANAENIKSLTIRVFRLEEEMRGLKNPMPRKDAWKCTESGKIAILTLEGEIITHPGPPEEPERGEDGES